MVILTLLVDDWWLVGYKIYARAPLHRRGHNLHYICATAMRETLINFEDCDKIVNKTITLDVHFILWCIVKELFMQTVG